MHVFISYSQKDRRRRDQIAELLESNGMEVWFDDQNIQTGDRLTEEIFPAIENSACLIVIHTKNSSKSDWVLKEVSHADQKSIPVVVITFGSVTLPDKFPESVKDIKHVSVKSRLTQTKRRDFVQNVRRYYFQPKAPIVTVLNIKGGVGKTALSANLFGCLHEHHRKSVLLIDLDPQHNLTQLLIDPNRMTAADRRGANVMAMFRGFGQPTLNENIGLTPADVEKVLNRCKYPLKSFDDGDVRLDLIPGSFELITFFLGAQHQHYDRNEISWRNFGAFIKFCQTQYDLIVIDVNPGSSLMTEVALEVSTHILSPIRPDRFSRYGIGLLHQLLYKLEVPKDRIRLLAIMNGVERKRVDEIEQQIRSEDQPDWIYDHQILESRVAYSKRMEARPVPPSVNNLTSNLAYQPAFGSQAIRNDLIAASSELIEELSL